MRSPPVRGVNYIQTRYNICTHQNFPTSMRSVRPTHQYHTRSGCWCIDSHRNIDSFVAARSCSCRHVVSSHSIRNCTVSVDYLWRIRIYDLYDLFKLDSTSARNVDSLQPDPKPIPCPCTRPIITAMLSITAALQSAPCSRPADAPFDVVDHPPDPSQVALAPHLSRTHCAHRLEFGRA